jgi:predicted phosphoribosyltransferase
MFRSTTRGARKSAPFLFDDLGTAGRALALSLEHHRGAGNAIVLGIVRGGVPAAREVANGLGLSFDLVLLRALLQCLSGDLIFAARVAGTLVLDDGLPASPSVEATFVVEALEALAQRELLCRGERSPLDVANRTVLLIDNGMRTGRTMSAAVRAVRKLGPSRIVAATPVAAISARAVVGPLADELVCLATPDPFPHVGMYYGNFDVPKDEQIRSLVET